MPQDLDEVQEGLPVHSHLTVPEQAENPFLMSVKNI